MVISSSSSHDAVDVNTGTMTNVQKVGMLPKNTMMSSPTNAVGVEGRVKKESSVVGDQHEKLVVSNKNFI